MRRMRCGVNATRTLASVLAAADDRIDRHVTGFDAVRTGTHATRFGRGVIMGGKRIRVDGRNTMEKRSCASALASC